MKKSNSKISFSPTPLLKSDHKVVAELFKKIMATTNRGVKTREELFHELKMNLDIHAHIEEGIFYPAVKEPKSTHAMTLEAYEEHHVVKHLLKELDEMEKNSDEWKAKLTVLKEIVEHHVKEEETKMFPQANKIVSKSELAELAEEMTVAKEDMQRQLLAA